jgi:NAD(P)-dependent dehydrogenase (short-subunit alcohol dehydrogenase family)
MTPMVRKNFEDDPGLREIWERENMLGRLSEPSEFRGAALFLLSDASSFMTGSQVRSILHEAGDTDASSSSLMAAIQHGSPPCVDGIYLFDRFRSSSPESLSV